MERRNANIRKRINYYDDYKKTASGEYVYSGLRYEYESLTGKKRSVWMREILLMCIAAFAVMFPPGFMHVPGLSYCAYVLLPYGAAIIASGYLLVIAGRLAMAKDDVKAWEYDKSIKAFPAASILLVVVSTIGVICEIIYVILNGMNGRVLEFIVYIACQLISGALAMLISRQVKTVNWKVIESNGI